MKPRLTALILVFTKIGLVSFGGFISMVSVIQTEISERKKLITEPQFLEGMSLAAIMPGPLAVNLVFYIGYILRGLSGACLCALAVLTPAFLIILGISVLYFRQVPIPYSDIIIAGFLPPLVAIILSVALNLFRSNVKNFFQSIVFLLSLLAMLFLKGSWTGIGIVLVSAMLGIAYARYAGLKEKEENEETKLSVGNELKKTPVYLLLFLLGLLILLVVVLPFFDSTHILLKLLSVFSGISISLFGGGYVFVPLGQQIIVEKLNWVTSVEFADALAFGQITPGPIMVSAGFIGYKVSGVLGAVVSTIGIFLPSGILMMLGTMYFDKIKTNNYVKNAYLGIKPAIVGMIVAAAYFLWFSREHNFASYFLLLLALVLFIKFKASPVMVIPLFGILYLVIINIL